MITNIGVHAVLLCEAVFWYKVLRPVVTQISNALTGTIMPKRT
jgi:hypothetical protein